MNGLCLKALAACVAAFVMTAAEAAGWSGLADANHRANGKVGEADLFGKVVLVDYWSTTVQPSRNIQPRVEQIWKSFKGKPFAVVGSVEGGEAAEVAAFAAKNGITFPMYARVGYDGKGPGGKAPYFFVVDARGKLVYAGDSDRDATEAVVNAIGRASAGDSLAGEYVFGMKSKYRMLEKQLVLGKDVTSAVKKLEGDVAAANKKTATKMAKEKAAEARRILDAIADAKAAVREEIAFRRKADPERALKLIKGFQASFPKEGAEYKDDVAALTEAAKAKKEGMAK